MASTTSSGPYNTYERASPPPADNSGPRFTEHFNAAPPYQQFQALTSYPVETPRDASYDQYDLQHRFSNKERPTSPPSEIGSPLPEFVIPEQSEKEVAIPPIQPYPYQRPPEDSKREAKWTAGKWLLLLAALLLLVAIGLGVGLGVGLTRHHTSPSVSAPTSTGSESNSSSSTPAPTVGDSKYTIGGALDPAYFSHSGAFNGSGIALASQSFTIDLSAGTHGNLVAYFQHWTGQIRWMQLNNSGSWNGGDSSSIVALDAKNSTPLSAVAYVSNGSSTWHVFYVDKQNHIRQRSNSNTTNVWQDGTINHLNLTVNDADQVGMQACWYGNDYGDSEYTHTPVPGGNQTQPDSDVGMHMWYASDNTTFQQYGWRDGDTSWELQDSWPNKNGHAGVGCYSWGPGTVTYVMFVNLDNTVEIWYKDTNTSIANTTQHPINQWTNTSIAINNVHPSTSLGYTNVFYAQMADTLQFNGYNISWAAENTSFIAADQFTVDGNPGVPGTHLSVTAIPSSSGGNDLLVFYQTNGTDVSEYKRDFVAGQWSLVDLNIPQT